jgi:hypothetical protein
MRLNFAFLQYRRKIVNRLNFAWLRYVHTIHTYVNALANITFGMHHLRHSVRLRTTQKTEYYTKWPLLAWARILGDKISSWKTRPKCSPNYFLSKLIHSCFLGMK